MLFPMDLESVAGIIFTPDRNAVLLILRRDVPIWVLPGGGIDLGETSEEAIQREILEETGFTVKIDRLVGDYFPINRLAKRTHLFECSIIKGIATLSEETAGVHFFPLSELPPMPPPYPDWILDGLQKGPLLIKSLNKVTYKQLFVYLLTHPLLVIRFLFSRFKKYFSP